MENINLKKSNILKLMMRCVLLCICFCLFSLPLSGCSIFGKKDYTISYDIESDPINLDPQTAKDKPSLIVITNSFEGLYAVATTGEAVPAIAQTVSFENNKYTFTLRKDAVWENGERVTAYDFEFGFKRLLLPETNSPGASQFFFIKNAEVVNKGEAAPSLLGVKAVSEDILEISVEKNPDNFFHLISSTYAMPCNEEFFVSTKGRYGLDSDRILANGAFDIYSWKHDATIKLRCSKTYYDKENVLPQGVTLNISPVLENVKRLDEDMVNAAFVPRDGIEQFEQKGYNITPIENSTWGLFINCKRPLTSNENIRKGIAMAFDRSSYTQKLSKNLTVAEAIVPHGILIYEKSYREGISDKLAPKYSPKEAMEAIKLGLGELDKNMLNPLTMIIDKDAMGEAAGIFSFPSQVLQRDVSVFINIEELSAQEYSARVNSGDFDIAFTTAFKDDYSIFSAFSSFTTSSQANVLGYSNEELDLLISEATLAPDIKTAKGKLYAAEQLILNEAVFIPMFYSTDYFVESKKTTGIYYNEQNGLVSFKSAVIS